MTDLVQGTDEWKRERLGKVTASRVCDVIARTKSGWGASRANYAAQLIAERLTGEVQEFYQNAAMAWGTATEPEARIAYEFRTDATVTEVGFVPHPTIAMTGASPDGIIGEDGLIEIKAPLTSTHLETLLGEGAPSKYIPQIQWQLACTGRKYCDFVSYDPRMPESMRLYVHRVQRDDPYIAELEAAVTEFLAEIDRKVAELSARYETRRAA